MKYVFPIVVFLTVFLITPTITFAQGGLVTCTGPNLPGEQQCNFCTFMEMIHNVIGYIISLLIIISVIMLAWTGLQLVMQAGNETSQRLLKERLTNLVIGFFLILAAWAIVDTVIKALVADDTIRDDWRTLFTSSVGDWCGNQLRPTLMRDGGTFGLYAGGVQGMNCTMIRPGEFDCSTQVQTCEQQEGTAEIDRSDPTQHVVMCSLPHLGAGGSCSVTSDPTNACHPSKLGCFGGTGAASQVCNVESAGGRTSVMSGSDLCKDGNSFSGGLWQINILAHHSRIPGCSSNFYQTNGSGIHGDCLDRRRNSAGVSYCAMWDCQITDHTMYQHCVSQVQDPAINTDIACFLYDDGGWSPWLTTARTCGIR